MIPASIAQLGLDDAGRFPGVAGDALPLHQPPQGLAAAAHRDSLLTPPPMASVSGWKMFTTLAMPAAR